ncbi:phasin family protein [Azoarcus olearius]|uniref:Phasin family protein n=1 Tax=Azoarcus sp. (strain BH72) TaxID=418699 RepID=A1K958_AZOSB|nr:phasin family protein [Azoarcus olearius]ANQ85910.1 hypothetical protein dqs_2882 [Azoarcus olearius]CAL95363.1 conserved hypothetical protein [Azoarcus olearius]
MSSYFSLQKLTDAANANGNALKSAFDIGLDASERFVALNFATLRSLSAGYKPLGEDVFEQFSGQFKTPVQGIEQATDYLRNVSDIYVKAQADIARLNSERLNGVSQQVNELLDDVARTGPAGTAEVVGKVKTALNSVTEAYENILRTTREATEHQFAAASNALQPIVASAKASKKAA